MLETELQTKCIVWLRNTYPNEVLIANVHGGGWGNKGFPDMLICIHGRFITCELKVGDNTLQPSQRMWKKKIEDAGGHWYEARTLERFKEIVEDELKKD